VEVVDNRNEVREFLASRRAKLSPEQAGVPFYGRRRRVPGLRREEVAQLAGVSTDYYTRLEKGDPSSASDSVLHAIAEALRLDEAEPAYLFRPGPRRPRPGPGSPAAALAQRHGLAVCGHLRGVLQEQLVLTFSTPLRRTGDPGLVARRTSSAFSHISASATMSACRIPRVMWS
jgi:transcriptional regulator with XRE-family HTH domain